MSTRNGDGIIRVVVAAVSAVRREGMEGIVRKNLSLKLVGSLPGLIGFSARARELQPHVVIVDLAQADTQFFSAANDLERAGIAVVVLIDEPSVGWTARALRAGVKAIVIASTQARDASDAARLREAEIQRRTALRTVPPSEDPLVHTLTAAADQSIALWACSIELAGIWIRQSPGLQSFRALMSSPFSPLRSSNFRQASVCLRTANLKTCWPSW